MRMASGPKYTTATQNVAGGKLRAHCVGDKRRSSRRISQNGSAICAIAEHRNETISPKGQLQEARQSIRFVSRSSFWSLRRGHGALRGGGNSSVNVFADDFVGAADEIPVARPVAAAHFAASSNRATAKSGG
jgi:hypothetical protein